MDRLSSWLPPRDGVKLARESADLERGNTLGRNVVSRGERKKWLWLLANL